VVAGWQESARPALIQVRRWPRVPHSIRVNALALRDWRLKANNLEEVMAKVIVLGAGIGGKISSPNPPRYAAVRSGTRIDGAR
jgi:hypothetical protein